MTPLVPHLFACAICLGDPNAGSTAAANAAIILMLAVLVLVLGGVGAFFAYLGKRSSAGS